MNEIYELTFKSVVNGKKSSLLIYDEKEGYNLYHELSDKLMELGILVDINKRKVFKIHKKEE